MPRETILYVDDEAVNRRNFRIAFDEEFHVLTADNGPDALLLFGSRQDISVVVADQRMPDMTGVELLVKLYQKDPDPIRMILTAYTEAEDIIGTINQGKVYGYIVKPWNPDELRAALRNACQTFRLKKENKEYLQDITSKNAILARLNDELSRTNRQLATELQERKKWKPRSGSRMTAIKP